MLDRNRLKSVIVLHGKTQEDVANAVGIVPKTFYRKMKSGVFNSDEISKMMKYLEIDDPKPIFFASEVS